MSELNSTSYVILGLLTISPDQSGYDMRKLIKQSIGYFWSESYGQLYPSLKRLAAGGLISHSRAGGGGRKQRQTYRLTGAGRAALRKWLAVPFQNEPPRNEFLLKLFFARESAPGVAIAHLRDLNERNRQALALLTNIESSIPAEQREHPHMPYWMLALSFGAALTRSALEWGEEALSVLEHSNGHNGADRSAGKRPAGSNRSSKIKRPNKLSTARPSRRVAR